MDEVSKEKEKVAVTAVGPKYATKCTTLAQEVREKTADNGNNGSESRHKGPNTALGDILFQYLDIKLAVADGIFKDVNQKNKSPWTKKKNYLVKQMI